MRYILFLFLLTSCSKKNSDISDLSFEKNSAFVINGGDNSISVIDTKSFEEKGRYYFKNGGNSFGHHIYLSKDYSKLSVAFPEYDFSNGHSGLHGASVKGNVGILDLIKKSEKVFPVSFANHNAVFSNDGKEIWTGLVSHAGKVKVFDANTFALIKEIAVGPDPSEIIFAKNGELALVACGETSFLTVIDAKKKEIIREMKVDPFPTNVWPGWNQSIVFVENSNAKSLNIVDLDNFKVIDFIDFDFVPGFAVFNAKANELWVCAPKSNKVYVYQKNQTEWIQKIEIPTDVDPHQIGFLKDGKTALIVNQKGNSVQVVDVSSKKIIKKLNVGLKPNGIAIWE
jgi:YVTN family beta-propeller protein